MPLPDVLLLASAGVAAGLINAVAGGGTFFTFPALLGVGLPAVAANATSAFSLGPGSLASALAYRREIARYYRRFLTLGVLSLVGSVLGALVLLRFDNGAFARLVPYLLLAATLLFALNPYLSRRFTRGAAGGSRARRWGGLALQFLTAVYGGFFGAGMGIIMLGSLTLVEGDDYHRVNAAKNLLAVLIKLAALVLFVFARVISWPEALVLTVASVLGGYLGVVLARRVPIVWVRGFVVVVGAALSLRYFLAPA